MPLYLIRDDITRMSSDAVVTAADPSLRDRGGVDGAIRKAAGPELEKACRAFGGCPAGEARITPGFDLPAKYVIHAVGPVWQGGGKGESELLAACYRNAFALAAEKGLQSVAFPLISSGAFGFPKEEAIRVARMAAEDFLRDHEMRLTMVFFDRESFSIGKEKYESIRAYIDDHYAAAHAPDRNRRVLREGEIPFESFAAGEPLPPAPAAPAPEMLPEKKKSLFGREKKREKKAFSAKAPRVEEEIGAASFPGDLPEDLQNAVKSLDESFSRTLLRKIDEKGMTDVACYKKANVDRKLFSKIRSDPAYRPGKATALAFAVALELTLPETEDLLRKAGFALSPSSTFDVIIEYYIKNGNYDIYAINEALFAFDQPILG